MPRPGGELRQGVELLGPQTFDLSQARLAKGIVQFVQVGLELLQSTGSCQPAVLGRQGQKIG